MKHTRYIALLAGLCAALTARAQNEVIDVTNTYEPTAPEVRKADLPMALPDSLLQFDYQYDYTVFDNPFKGSYEFSPYLIGITPETKEEFRRLYVKAGAGYSLRPTLDAVWTPESRFNVRVTARHDSYFGRMRDFSSYAAQGQASLAGPATLESDGTTYGRDMVNALGISADHDAGDWLLRLAAGYDGISAKDYSLSRNLHSGFLKADVRSADSAQIVWSGNAQYRYTRDDIKQALGVNENHLLLGAGLGTTLGNGHFVGASLSFEQAFYGGDWDAYGGLLTVYPHYDITTPYWAFSFGARLHASFHSSRTDIAAYNADDIHSGRWLLPVPAVTVEYTAYRDLLVPFVRLTGGASLNNWSAMVRDNHFRYDAMARPDGAPMEDSFERLRAELGFRGRIGYVLSYQLSGGYASVHNGLVDAWLTPAAFTPATTYDFADYGQAFADLRYEFRYGGVESDARLALRKTYVEEGEGDYDGHTTYFGPAMLSGSVRFGYNWHNRLHVGVDFGFETSRKGVGEMQLTVPGWVDLGLDARYRFNRRLSFWAQAGNLLGNDIQRHLLHAEAGAYVTAGVIFSL